MGANTSIEWADHSFNPWVGCQKVSPGCDHCYAEAHFANRLRFVEWGPHGMRRRTSPARWAEVRRWAKDAEAKGERRRVFCASAADVFDNRAPAGARAELFDLIRATRGLDWLLLTKRPENIRRMLPDGWGEGWRHVWLGATCEDQPHFDRRWPILRAVPAAIRFLSYEPALGPLRLHGSLPDWIICGGESGPHARPMNPAWVRNLRDQCAELGVRFFMKQMGGSMRPLPAIPADLLIRQFPAPPADQEEPP